MRERLLDWIVCPRCGSTLEAEVFGRAQLRSTRDEIREALLHCRCCKNAYPVVDGIPRMLPDSLETYAHLLPVSVPALALSVGHEAECFRKLQGSTRESFGFEWLRYQVTEFRENVEFFRAVTGFDRSNVQGKLVLDAGCGMGRFLEVAASLGAEVVGVDLSSSVERARRETNHPENVHFVQGDIMNPPFRRAIFDAAYSIGVLHHTPDTHRAFQSLCPLVKSGGEMAIWVYRSYLPEVEVEFHKKSLARVIGWVSDGTRALTTRLPHSLLHYLCYAAVPLGWLKRRVQRNRALKHLCWPLLLPPVSDHSDWRVRLCDTFDWLSPRYQWKHTTNEVLAWFEGEGWESIRAQDKPVSVRGVKPGYEPGVAATALVSPRAPERRSYVTP